MKKVILVFLACLMVSMQSVAWAENQITAQHLTWSEASDSTQTITWQMAELNPDMVVEYQEENSADRNKIAASVEPFYNEIATRYVYHVVLRDLKPNMRYAYRIGDGTVWSETAQFKSVAGRDACEFLLFGDSQSYNYAVWGNTLQRAYQAHQNADFFVNVGDLVDNGQRLSEWENWFSQGQTIMRQLPLVPVVGNHEAYTPSREFSLPKYFTTQFVLPQNGPSDLKEQAYSFDYANVHFVVLDTQFGEERKFVPDSLAKQLKWLEDDLAKTDKTWKIVFMHRAPYHNRADKGFDDTIQFVPLFEQYNVDVVFTAHDHVCARTAAMKAGQAAEGGVVYATTGRSGTKVYDTVAAKEWNIKFFNPVDEPTYSTISIHEKKITVNVWTQRGALIDTWSIEKK